MRRIYLILILLGSRLFCAAPNLEGQIVGPGVIHYHDFIAQGPWHIHILKVDLHNEWIQLETAKANNLLYGNERTSAMSARSDREEHRIVGAINGDFYATGGIPIGAQVLNGDLLKRPYPRSALAFGPQNQPYMNVFSFESELNSAQNSKWTVDGVNEERGTDQLILFNSFFGSSTGTNYWGTEIKTRFVSDTHLVNDSVPLVVVAKDSIMSSGHGNNSIPRDGLIFSGHGLAARFLNNSVFIGDTLSYIVKLPPTIKAISQMIGGTPRLIRDGTKSIEWQNENLSESFATDRHPRTAAGFNADSSSLFLFTVDGRQAGYSAGMSLSELADYMLSWNVYQGVNLDGGGSTTMVVRGEIVNQPSDGGERAVANALMVVNTAPRSATAHIRITPENPHILRQTSLQFSAQALDETYNPDPVNADSNFVWSCDPALGQFDANGLFTTAADTISGSVYVQSAGITDSTNVRITVITALDLKPDPVILKVNESQQMVLEARDNLDQVIKVTNNQASWSCTASLGQISAEGLFRAGNEGSGWIIAHYLNLTDSVQLNVGSSQSQIIDPFDSIDRYSLSGTKVNLAACSLSADTGKYISGPASAKLDYDLSSGGTSALYLNCNLPVSGSPQSAGIYIYGDGRKHWLRGQFEDADGEKFIVNFTQDNPGIDWLDNWEYAEVAMADAIPHWSNGSAVLTFPITWKQIYLVETDENKKDSGTIYLDDFTVTYLQTSIDGKTGGEFPRYFELLPNYPNPFNPSTTIRYALPKKSLVNLSIFNSLGQKIETLVQSRQPAGRYQLLWQAAPLSSGIYYCQLQCPDFSKTRKLLFLK